MGLWWFGQFTVLAVVACAQQATICKQCAMMGKEEKAMFRAHSEACLPQSHVDPKLVESMLNGELVDDPGLRKHVYCVLLQCKMIGKDGKLKKAAVLGKMATKGDARNATKVLDSCSDQIGDTPEDKAWNLFRCGYDKKAILFDYMPTGEARTFLGTDIENRTYSMLQMPSTGNMLHLTYHILLLSSTLFIYI